MTAESGHQHDQTSGQLPPTAEHSGERARGDENQLLRVFVLAHHSRPSFTLSNTTRQFLDADLVDACM
ncbi:MAG TPA: hypothetical protein VK053_08870 [Jiangellaceae bacterium]|nr:hypothetical protein [Jiangellaceae bacterium]